MAERRDLKARLAALRVAYRELTARLAQTGFILPGTVERRMLTCGKPQCACKRDPARRHGPYAYWTSKKGRKTVALLLTPEQAELYEQWIENRRTLDETIRAMKRLSRQAAKAEIRLRAQKTAGRQTQAMPP